MKTKIRNIYINLLIVVSAALLINGQAIAGEVALSGSTLVVSAPSGNIIKLVLRVSGPNGLEKLESDGSPLVFSASSQPNGDYNFHTWAIAQDGDGNKSQISNEKGNFDIKNGSIKITSNESDELGYLNQTSSPNVIVSLANHVMNALVPLAHAQNVLVDSTFPTIIFEDTDGAATDTDAREWLVRGEEAEFHIADDTNDATATNFNRVIRIQSLAPAATTKPTENSIVIENDGDISMADGNFFIDKVAGKGSALGLGTNTPEDGVHVVSSGKNQYIKLENTSQSTWTMGQQSGGDFRINIEENGTAGLTGAVLSIPDQTGYVGINTTAPTSKLTVAGTDDARVAIINSDVSSVTSRVMVNMVNSGAPVVQMNDTSTGDQWNFRTGSGGRFVIDSPGGNNPQMQVFQTGNVNITGTLTEGSSRTYKDGLVKVDEAEILTKLKQLDISEWSYKSEVSDTDDSKRVRHLGPMAEDFYSLFGLGATEKGIASLDTAGVAIAAIKGLSNMIDDKAAIIDSQNESLTALEQENNELSMRLEQLESIVFSLQAGQDELASN